VTSCPPRFKGVIDQSILLLWRGHIKSVIRYSALVSLTILPSPSPSSFPGSCPPILGSGACIYRHPTVMESSLRDILHATEPTYESSTLHPGHLPNASDGSLDYTEAPPGSADSRKRPASRIKSSYPRKRAIQACQKCRVRRTKCNNERPACSSCLSIGAECTYTEGDHST
jgi:hypothetical protein